VLGLCHNTIKAFAIKESIMQSNLDLSQFQLALLMDDIAEAKELSDAFRELGLYAHFYDNLDDFWVAANTQTPDLTIVDVKKMSSGTILFKNHPKVQKNGLCFAFYYKDETKVLLNSTYGLNHYGFIRKEINLTGQIQNILRRRNEELHLLEQNKELSARVARLQKRSERIQHDAQLSFNFENQFQSLTNLIERIGHAKSKDDFIKNLATVMGQWDQCAQFGIYHLTVNGQKLVSPQIVRPKYKQLPQLWLSKVCEQGIADYAIEMAEEVAFDSIEKMVRVIKITGAYNNPDIIIMAKMDEDRLQEFQWNLFEERLAGLYGKVLLQAIAAPTQHAQNDITVWEAFSYMDDIHFHQAKTTHKLFVLDFSALLNTIKEKHGNRFYWKSFYSDFKEELTGLLSGNFKMAQYGAQNMMIFIDKTFLEVDYQKIKACISTFEFWRYFEDSSIMMTEQMLPEMKAIAPSSVNFIRQVYTDIMQAGNQTTRRHRSVWEEKQIQN
jgi:hypothetical protein